jgi:AcrR family transcriptional regulator
MQQPQDSSVPVVNKPQLSREQILKATAQCLAEHGYDGTTIRRIAATLNCAVGSIYRYFTDKRELLFVVTQQMLDPVLVLLDAGATFEQTVLGYHQRASANPAAYRLMFWLAAVQDENPAARQLEGSPIPTPPIPPVVQKIIAGWSGMLGDAALAHRCWALLHGSLVIGQAGETTAVMLRHTLAQAGVQRDLAARREQPVDAVPADHHAAVAAARRSSEDVTLL